MSTTFWVCCGSFLIVFSLLGAIIALSLCKISKESDEVLEERLRAIMEEKYE